MKIILLGEINMTGKAFNTTSIDAHIGLRMQLRRNMMGMSQKDLSKICGVTFQQIQKYETAGNRISASRLFELSVALQTPIAFFFSGLPGHIDHEPRNGKLTKNRLNDRNPEDPLSKNESLQLINMYWKLPNDKQREIVFKLLKTLNGLDN